MNTLVANVSSIKTLDSLNIVKFDSMGEILSMMSLELDAKVKVGAKVELTTKPSLIAIAKEFSGVLSYSNQLDAKIISIENGELLSSITLQVKESVLESIITLDSVKKMDLNVGDDVTAFIKASELSILRVLDD